MMETLLMAIVAAPGVTFLALSLLWLAGGTPSERFVARCTAAAFSLMTAGLAWLTCLMFASGTLSVRVSLGDWFRAHPEVSH